ncbi:MAG: ATP-binding protein [Prolixibacteraceae bacterium]|jgi:light-regulated signal transduction histidine kinase (bacteriophytochrome)|nr:ATP-binding protein [Prolixibacteraceae bacterium]
MSKYLFIHNLSIKNKIIAIVLFISVTVISVGFIYIVSREIMNSRKEVLSRLLLDATLIGDYCIVPLTFEDRQQATETLSRLKYLEPVEAGYLLDKNGNLFATYPDTPGTDNVPAEAGTPKATYRNGYFHITEPIKFQDNVLGTICIRANSKTLQKEEQKLIGIMILLLLALVALAYMLASKIQRLISTPILTLSELTATISEKQDFNIRLEPQGNDEVGILYQQFNNLLQTLRKRKEERDKAEEEIRELNAILEKKVAERTALLEAANKEMEAFSYSVSHDLRAPLRHINGYVELLLKRNSDQLNEKGQHYLNAISESSSQMGALIDNLLQFSRTGRTEMRRGKTDMNKQVQDALSILEQDMSGRKIEWAIGTLPVVFADQALIRQVWVNLIGNAIKYTGPCETAIIEIGADENQEEFIFYIRDNGAGFNMEYVHKLFGVFQRLHSNDEFEGTGIGLANVKQIVKKHNGRAWAEGEVGKGATFYFSLPKE